MAEALRSRSTARRVEGRRRRLGSTGRTITLDVIVAPAKNGGGEPPNSRRPLGRVAYADVILAKGGLRTDLAFF